MKFTLHLFLQDWEQTPFLQAIVFIQERDLGQTKSKDMLDLCKEEKRQSISPKSFHELGIVNRCDLHIMVDNRERNALLKFF